MSFQAKRPILNLFMMVGLLSLFAVGCGDSRGEYYQGSAVPIPEVGSLLFKFEQPVLAQAEDASLLPAGTETLRFDFFTSVTPTPSGYLFSRSRPVADEILIENVPLNARSVVVTAFDASGSSLGSAFGDFEVIQLDTVIVVLSLFTSDTPIVKFSVSAENSGSADEPIAFPSEDSDFILTADELQYSAFLTVDDSELDVLDEVDFSFAGSVIGVEIDETDGALRFTDEYQGGSFTVVVTYIFDDNVYTDNITFFVSAAPIGPAHSFRASALYHPDGDETETPVNGETPITPYFYVSDGMADLSADNDLSYVLEYSVDETDIGTDDGTVVYSLVDASDLVDVTIDPLDGSLDFDVFDLDTKKELDEDNNLRFSVLVTFTNADGEVFTDTIDFLVNFDGFFPPD